MSRSLFISAAFLMSAWASSCTQDPAPDDMAAVPADLAVADAAMTDAAQASDLAFVDLAQLVDPNDGPGVFAGVGNNVRHIRSLDDGLTWIDDATEIPPSDMVGDDNGIRTVIAANHQFIAFAAKLFTSPDGNAWTEVKTGGQWLASMLYADGQYVSSGGYGWLATTVSDLNSWTQNSPYTNYIAAHHSRRALAHGTVAGQSAYVVVNDDGELFHSDDGKAWQATSGAPVVPAGATWGTQLTYGAGAFVGLLPSGTGLILSTDGGSTWTSPAPFATVVTSIVYAQGHFTAVGAGHVYTSVDGATWTDHVQASAQAGDLTYGHGVYLTLIWNGDIYRSTDGMTWSRVFQNLSNPDQVASIAFNPN